MLRLKLINPFCGRNEPTFRMLVQNKDTFRDYELDIRIDDFGFGEARTADIECNLLGAVLVKEDMSGYTSDLDIWDPYITYISFDYSCNNLNFVLEDAILNYNKYSSIRDLFLKRARKEYSVEKLALSWYNIFRNLDSVVEHKI